MTVKATSAIRLRLRVSGVVQGVYFRASTREQAVALGVVGWVRNSPDGSVLVEAEGEPEAVRELADFCRIGPPAARVTAVDVEEIPVVGGERSFEVRY